jgi:hypothetical protein
MIEQYKDKSGTVTYYKNHPYYSRYKYRNAILRRDTRDQHKWLKILKDDVSKAIRGDYEAI